MFRKHLPLVIVALLTHVISFVAPAAASARTEKEARAAAKIKAAVLRLGTGPDACVMVKLWNKTKLKGHVSEGSVAKNILTAIY